MVSNGGKFEMQLHKVPHMVEEHEFFKKYFQKMALVIFLPKLKLCLKNQVLLELAWGYHLSASI